VATSPLRPMPTSVVASPTDASPMASRRLPRAHRRWAAAAVATVLAVTAIAFASALSIPTGPGGQVAGIVGMPHDATDRPRPSGFVATRGPAAGGGEPPEVAEQGSTTGTSAPRSGGSTPEAPVPTPPPRPRPIPTPTANPTATPCLAVAPQLTGERRNDAAGIWSQAGFSGPVTAVEGHGNYLIASQSRTAGREYPCNVGITVGP